MVIAIDGPAGAGKSTVSKALSRRLGFTYMDTGAMYRAVALAVKRSCLGLDDPEALDRLCRGLEIGFDSGRVLLNGEDVSPFIRTPEMDGLSSAISSIELVREHLVRLQRELARGADIVAEGRDMGTVVFPDAEHKFFLTASLEERARRRRQDLEARGILMDFEDVMRAISERDRADSTRSVSPLRPAPDAVAIDSSEMDVEQVIDLIIGFIQGDRI